MIPDIHNMDGETKEQKFAKARHEMKNQFAPSEVDTWISNMEQNSAINQAKEEKKKCVHRGLLESMTKKPTMMRDHLTAECGTRREEAKGSHKVLKALDCKGALLPHFPEPLMFSGDGRQEELIWRTAKAKMLSNSRSLANLEQDDETLTATEESLWKQCLSCQKCGNQSEGPSTLVAHITMKHSDAFQTIHDGKNVHQGRPDSQNGHDKKMKLPR